MRRTTILVLTLALAATDARAEVLHVGGSLGAARFEGTADADRPDFVGPVPEVISIDGSPFESTESTWSVHGGWQIKRWLALEAGFSDLGNSGVEQIVGITSIPGVLQTRRRSIAIEEWQVAARFSVALSQRFSADWVVGLTRAQFDVDGSIPLRLGPAPFFEIEEVPFESPDDETGLVWGFGFGWKLHERVRLGIEYRQHNTRVLDIDTLSIQAAFSIL